MIMTFEVRELRHTLTEEPAVHRAWFKLDVIRELMCQVAWRHGKQQLWA